DVARVAARAGRREIRRGKSAARSFRLPGQRLAFALLELAIQTLDPVRKLAVLEIVIARNPAKGGIHPEREIGALPAEQDRRAILERHRDHTRRIARVLELVAHGAPEETARRRAHARNRGRADGLKVRIFRAIDSRTLLVVEPVV